jgi:isoquinoline 1-oxidoreductase subunit alpha
MTSLTINNQPVRYRMDPQTPLLWAIRDASNLTGTKYGCGTGDCGACTVDIDGRAVRSCQITIAQAEGAFVTTIEALSRDRSHPVALLKANPHPSDADIDAAITNICRCGTYTRIRRAIHRAARAIAGQETIVAAPPPGIDPADAARAVPALTPVPTK